MSYILYIQNITSKTFEHVSTYPLRVLMKFCFEVTKKVRRMYLSGSVS